MLGFFFMLRASEYLVQKSRSWSADRVLHGEDVEGRDDANRPVWDFSRAMEVVIHIKGSKTDQYNVGSVRNQYRTHTELCPLGALEEYQRHFPQRLDGSERGLPLGRWASGSEILREDVQHYLTVAALAAGLRQDEVGPHSLRIRGAGDASCR